MHDPKKNGPLEPQKSSQLKKRVITASLLIPAVLLAIFFLPAEWFALVCGIFCILAAWEWSALAGFKSWLGRLFCIAAIPIVFLIFLILIQYLTDPKFLLYRMGPTSLGLEDSLVHSEPLLYLLQLIIVGGWILAGLAVYFFPRGKSFYSSRTAGIFIGTWLLAPFFASLVTLRTLNPLILLYPMILIWVADSGAYFVGKRFGKNPLVPNVSAGKTIEGVVGAVLACILLSLISYFLFEIKIPIFVWIIFNIIIVLFSIVGDLFESIFKRIRGVKDSGTLLPGHGGILDRIDSLLAALPIFLIGLMSFG